LSNFYNYFSKIKKTKPMQTQKTHLFAACSVIALFSCFSFRTTLVQSARQLYFSIEKYIEKENEADEILYPNDQFWIQRTLPNQLPDEAAYRQAMEEARTQYAQRSPNAFQGFNLPWTTEGPANIGARVNSLAVNPTNESIMYAGFERGGVWKTTNGGTNWLPIMDSETCLSGGDITLDPSNPNTVYVGTGDPSIPFTTFSGNGIYKTTNGGTSWSNIGLTNCGVISRVEVAPNNSSTIYAAAMGKPFVRDNNRGLYKTTNGGATWQQVLFIDTQTGITDMAVNPVNPQEIYVAAWTCIRTYSENTRWSTECKILKTTNGGTTWTTVQGGLPVGSVHARLGLGMSKSQPNIVYVSYCDQSHQLEGVYKTTDSGTNWVEIPTVTGGVDATIFNGFGWYFGQIRVNPTNPNEVTLLGVEMFTTQDSGNSWFKSVPPWYTYEVHADKHDLVYTNTGKVILATDGGIYKANALTDNSTGSTWTDIDNIPCTQFYHVAYNPHDPTRYFGGAQDNGTTGGNAATLTTWSRDWGGDGFQPRYHATDPNILYYETQNGNIVGSIDGMGSSFNLQGGNANGERTNWNTPYILSPHNQNTVYMGSQSIYKSTDNGQTMTQISDTLTGNITWLPSTHTITSIDESPVTQGKIYAGTGNGYLWRTLNGGTTWDSIHQNGLPHRYLTSVVASPTQSNRVFVTFSGYKLNDNTPRVYRSDNNGNSWTSIASNLPNFVINDIFIMPNRNDQILFVATDAGVYGTLNAGATWERLGTNMPIIPVNDIEYNPVQNTLIAGTFARSIMTYPMANLLPTANAEAANLRLSLYPNPTSTLLNMTLAGDVLAGAQYTIYDLQGKEIPVEKTLFGDALNVAALPTGAYILQIITRKGQIYTQKWVKI
jgi:photosystem II stability/assembly factor-like uncharacterized protein